MPVLKRLLIKGFHMTEPYANPDVEGENAYSEDEGIRLSKLSLVQISTGEPSNIVRLLQAIEMPLTTCVHITQAKRVYNPRLIQLTGKPACRQVAIKHLTSTVCGSIHTLTCRDEHLRTIAQFTSSPGVLRQSRTTIYFDLIEGLPLDNVKSLVLQCEEEDMTGVGHLLMLPKLKRVAMVGSPSVWAFVHADTPVSIKDRRSDVQPVFVGQERSSLETFAVMDADLLPPSFSNAWSTLYSSIQQFVLDSRSNGAPLSTLILDDVEGGQEMSSLFMGQGHSILSVTDRRARGLSAVQRVGGMDEPISITTEGFSCYEWLYVTDSWTSVDSSGAVEESVNWCLPP